MSLDLENFYEITTRNRSCLDSFVVMPDGQIGDPLALLGLPNMGHRGMDHGIFAVVPGSFNPLHDAHKAIYNGIKTMYGEHRTVVPVFEISIQRRGKEPLSFEELKKRLKQFEWYAPVWVTNASLFFEKAGLVSYWIRPCFQIGFDTAKRLVEDHGVSGVQGIEANFIVHKRFIDGKFLGLQDLVELYGAYPRNMEESSFTIDPSISSISSTALRMAKND